MDKEYYKPFHCKKCNRVIYFDIRDYGAMFICPECETPHTYQEAQSDYSDWYADCFGDGA